VEAVSDKVAANGFAPLLQVFDMPTSVRFYCDVLGFALVQQSQPGQDFGWCRLRLGGSELMLNTAHDVGERPAAPDPARTRAHDDTCLYFACPDVDGAHAALKTRGLDVAAPSISPYRMKQLYLHDPDGFLLCFQWPI
jgi:glyoxylase I family protein